MEVTTLKPTTREQLLGVASDAGQIFKSGGLVIFPTETVYGLGASIANDKGFSALLNAKSRQATQPFTMHLPDASSAHRYADLSDPRMSRAIGKLLPGPVTAIMEVSDETQKLKAQALYDELTAAADPDDPPIASPQVLRERIYHSGTVGLRCPDHYVASFVLSAPVNRITDGEIDPQDELIGAPIAASSANLRGDAPPLDVDAATDAVGECAQLIVDGERCQYAKPSTIVRLTANEHGPVVTVEREGVYDERTIRKLLCYTILFVCTGNTCRSPMAAAIAKDVYAKQRGLAVDELVTAGIEIQSTGVFAGQGSPATGEAIDAMEQISIDLKKHRSQPISGELVDRADVIYCMTQSHYDTLMQMAPHLADKTQLLDPDGDIDDPIGGSLSVYQSCAKQIRLRIESQLNKHT